MTEPPASRIVVVDDEPTMRFILQTQLEAGGYQVTVAGDVLEARQVIARVEPHLLILDIGLGDGPDGLTLAREFGGTGPPALMVLSAAGDPSDVLAGFTAGVDEYVVKPPNLQLFLAQVAALLRRVGAPVPSIVRTGDLLIDEGAQRVTYRDAAVSLTGTELRLLVALARQPGHVVSKRDLVGRVWHHSVSSANVVEVTVKRLRAKLCHHGPDPIRTVRGTGYRLDADR